MAKVFTTNGTGASQTLDEASSNRLKVYDDYDSIDTTDLVDGEIVSTKETAADGSNVYDYIDKHIAAAQSYSTEEQLTGATWIDGKPIYRITKTGVTNFNNNDWTLITLFDDNVRKHIIKLDIVSAQTCLRPDALEIGNYIKLSTASSAGNGSTVYGSTYVLTIEYTKATD